MFFTLATNSHPWSDKGTGGTPSKKEKNYNVL